MIEGAVDGGYKRFLSGTAGRPNPFANSSVLVEILREISPGRYSVKINSKIFDVSSSFSLNPGESFRAFVYGGASVIYLTPDAAFTDASSVLKRSGLGDDALTERILQLFADFGVRIDIPAVLNARRAASCFSGKESEAAEIAFVLYEKGLPVTPSMIQAVMDFDRRSQGGSSGGRDKKSSRRDSDETKSADGAQNESEKRFPDALYICGLPGGSEERSGFLTVFNHCASAGSAFHWLALPYEIPAAADRFKINGVLRFLIDTDAKRTLRCVASASITRDDKENQPEARLYSRRWIASFYTDARELEVFSRPELKETEKKRFLDAAAEFSAYDDTFASIAYCGSGEDRFFWDNGGAGSKYAVVSGVDITV